MNLGFLLINILVLFAKCKTYPFKILFSKGSNVPSSMYEPFLHKLEQHLHQSIEFYNESTKNTPHQKIVITHSFGGTTTLCDIINKECYEKPHISGIVLINSHFNQRNKMPYFPLKQQDFHIPILSILTANDERLPLHATIDDFLVSTQEHIPNKFYLINRGDHFSTFEDPIELNLAVSQIKSFLTEIAEFGEEFPRSNYIKNHFTNKHSWFFQEREFHNTILRPNFFRFLVSKPQPNNSFYRSHKYNLLKTNAFNISKELDNYYHLDLKYNFTDYADLYYRDIMNSSHTVQKIIQNFYKGYTVRFLFLMTEFLVKEVSNDFFYKCKIPWFLYEWFTYEPKINIQNGRLCCEIMSIPIRDNIVYYKIPSKHKIFEFLAQKEVL